MDDATDQPWASWPGDTPILMGDWLVRPIGQVKPGDTVVAIERGDSMNRAKLAKTEVLATREMSAEMVRVRLASGRTITCGANNLWYTNRAAGPSDPTRKQYARHRVGSYLMQVDIAEDEPTERQRLLWYWLAGFVDGEGHIADSSLPITQTTGRNGPVWRRLCMVLDELNISYNVKIADRAKANWDPKADAVIRNVRDQYKRLLRYAEPAKRDQMIDALWHRPRRPIRSRDRIVSVEPAGTAAGWEIETAAGNCVAWAYAASVRAVQRVCPVGHPLNVRVDSRDKMYLSCRACAPAPVVRRPQRHALTADESACLQRAIAAIASGEARRIRQASGLVQKKLGYMCDVSGTRISQWETGSEPPNGPSGLRYARMLDQLAGQLI